MVLLSKDAIQKLSTPAVIGFDTILLDESIYGMGMKLYRRFEGTSKVSINNHVMPSPWHGRTKKSWIHSILVQR